MHVQPVTPACCSGLWRVATADVLTGWFPTLLVGLYEGRHLSWASVSACVHKRFGLSDKFALCNEVKHSHYCFGNGRACRHMCTLRGSKVPLLISRWHGAFMKLDSQMLGELSRRTRKTLKLGRSNDEVVANRSSSGPCSTRNMLFPTATQQGDQLLLFPLLLGR